MTVDSQSEPQGADTGNIVLTAEAVLALRMEAAELGALPAPTTISRPDGRPPLTGSLAEAAILPPQVASAQRRLADARESGTREEVVAAQRHLADVAGLKLREGDQDLPVPNDRPAIAELVCVDLMNRMQVGIKRYGAPLQSYNGRSALRDAYDEVLDLANYLRQLIEEGEIRAREAGVEDRPAPPAVRPGNVAVVSTSDGGYTAWQWRDCEWHPLITPGDFAGLTEEERAAIEEHAGPLPQ